MKKLKIMEDERGNKTKTFRHFFTISRGNRNNDNIFASVVLLLYRQLLAALQLL